MVTGSQRESWELTLGSLTPHSDILFLYILPVIRRMTDITARSPPQKQGTTLCINTATSSLLGLGMSSPVRQE